MAYFYTNQDAIGRAGKIVADVFCGILLLVFSLAIFGLLAGAVAFIILYGALVGIDFIVPDENADAGGAGIR
jgi:hypothetical protein